MCINVIKNGFERWTTWILERSILHQISWIVATESQKKIWLNNKPNDLKVYQQLKWINHASRRENAIWLINECRMFPYKETDDLAITRIYSSQNRFYETFFLSILSIDLCNRSITCNTIVYIDLAKIEGLPWQQQQQSTAVAASSL